MSHTTARRSLCRTVKVGETLVLDGGRIVIQLLDRTGRNASRIRLDLADDVVVHKPDSAADLLRRVSAAG